MGRRREVQQFPLRVPIPMYGEIQAKTFYHEISCNTLILEMIRFAHNHPSFHMYLDQHYPHDDSRGHFVFIPSERTEKHGIHSTPIVRTKRK